MTAATCPCVVTEDGKRRRDAEPQYPIRDGSRCKLFWCRGCKRYQPWCCGAADETPGLCDDCAALTPESAGAEAGAQPGVGVGVGVGKERGR